MQHSTNQIAPVEKLISIFSYLSMGFIGIFFVIVAHFLKKKLRYFFMYNIVQSIIIALILAIFQISVKIILQILSSIKFLDAIAAALNIILYYKIITIANFSFSIFQFLLFILITYIILGVLQGKIFYVKYLTDFTKKAMERYK